MQVSFHQFQRRLNIDRSLSEGRNLAETSLLATVGNLLANIQKKNLRNDGESGCGWLY